MNRTIALFVLIILIGVTVPLTSELTSAEGIGGWEFVSPLPETRVWFGLATDGKYMYIAGGATEPVGSDPLASLWRYDPSNDSYEELSPMNYPRTSTDMTFWNGTLWVFTHPYARNWEVYSIIDDKWTLIEPEPWYVFPDTECEVINDTFYFFAQDRAKLMVHHPQNGTYWNLTDLDHRHEDYATGYIDGALFMFGGYNETNHVAVNITKSFDLVDRRWYQWTPMPNPRYESQGVVVNDLVYIIGGIGDDGNTSGAVEAYCPYNDTWIGFPQMNQPRAFFRAVFHNGSIYSFGGASASRNEYYSSVERFDVPLADLCAMPMIIEGPTGFAIGAGSTVSLRVPVSNIGDWPARDVEVSLACDGAIVDTRTISFLGVDESTVVEFPWIAQEGRRILEVSVDSKEVIFEEFESNNVQIEEVEVRPNLPDIYVFGTDIDAPHMDGDEATVTADVNNAGWRVATGLTWQLLVDGTVVASGTVYHDLEPGDGTRISASWTAVAGTHELNISVTCPGEEVGAYPNWNATLVRVIDKPDLRLAGPPRFQPGHVGVGDDAVLVFSVTNSGEVQLEGAFVVIRRGGTVWESFNTGELGVNASVEFRRTFSADKVGTESFEVVVDADGLVQERDEGNNTATVELEVVKDEVVSGGLQLWMILLIVVATVGVGMALLYMRRRHKR